MAEAEVRERGLSVDGLGTRLLEAGPGTGEEAVVFVHGNPGSSEDWRDLLGEVGVFARGLGLDMPGFGRADKPRRFDYTVPGYAGFLERALNTLGVRRAHLVLHDFGGPFGLAWGAGRPDALASLVLINTGVFEDYSWHYLARIWRTPVVGELFQVMVTRRAFHLSLRRGNPRGLPRAFVDRMFDDYDAGTRRAVLRLYRATEVRGAAARLRAALSPVDPPTLVVWGARDPYLPVAYAARQRETFACAEVAVLPDSGHWPFADDPDGVKRVVVPFLRRVLG
jgi:pimeloyl-ACP methyl ester carboxylesterase